MCNPTSQPPRRDLYELETSMRTADNGPFLLPANRRIRVGAGNDAQRAQVYNADYMSDGTRYARFDKPWTAFTAIDFRTFKTQPEALAWVLQEARK
jgi:hypothetical protein